MGFDEGRIVLENPNGTYYSGQTIRGNLIFQQDSVKTCRGIYIAFKGHCKVHWTTKETRRVNGQNVSRTVHHSSYEEYINQKIYVLGSESGEHQIQTGKHDYPFVFQLPPNCPSSFEGLYGRIRYNIKAVVNKAFKINPKKKVAVQVFTPLDLNMDPYCRKPIEMDFNANYYTCCFSSGSTNTVVNVPLSGFCPGQSIPIEVTCNNKGKVNVGHVKFRIKKHVCFIATQNPGKRYDSVVLAEINKGPIPANMSRNWSLQMVVPAIDVYNLAACNYIILNYKLEVVVSPSGCHRNSEESANIVIGTVPLVGYQNSVPNPLQDQMPQQTEAMSQQPYNSSYPYPVNNLNPYPNPNPNIPHASAPYLDNPPPYPGNNLPYPGNDIPYPGGENATPNQMKPEKGAVGTIGFTIPSENANNAPYAEPNLVPSGWSDSGNPHTAASTPALNTGDNEKKEKHETL